MFLILMVSLNVDAVIANNADILSKFAVTFWGISLFIVIAAIFVFGQYYVLAMVRAKNKESQFKPRNANQLEKLMTAFQYSFAVIMVIVVLQIVSTNHYYTHFLTLSIVTSYCLTVFFMSLLAYKLFSWFKLNRRLVVLCYGLAAAMIVVNAVDSIILNVVPLLGKPPMVSPQSLVIFQTGYSPGTAMSVVTWIQSNSVLGYIILTWVATIFLLRAHIRRVGRIKFWVLVILPLVYFMSYNLSLYQSLYPNSPVTTVTSSSVLIPLLLLVFATTLCGILFGIGFWAVSRFLRRGSDVRDYMIITAFGLALFFTAADAGLLQAGYPPFGLADVLFVGLSSYLILIGLYHSAVSVAEDVTLRKFIKNSAMNESKLLDSIGTAQMTQEIENKVMKTTKANADLLAEQSGIEPSLTQDEIKEYVEKVIEEVKKIR